MTAKKNKFGDDEDSKPKGNFAKCQNVGRGCGKLVSTGHETWIRPANLCIACARDTADYYGISMNVVGAACAAESMLAWYKEREPMTTVRALLLASGVDILDPTTYEQEAAAKLRGRFTYLRGQAPAHWVEDFLDGVAAKTEIR